MVTAYGTVWIVSYLCYHLSPPREEGTIVTDDNAKKKKWKMSY